jgi:hypothetical protein
MNGGFEAQALKAGQDPDIKTLQLDISSDAAPVPHFSADPPGPVASNTTVTLKWTIDNFVLSGTSAQISADADPGDANFTFGGQDVHLDANGSGTLTVTPTNAGDFNFKLSVTPSGGTAVDSDPLKVTVQGTAPVPHLESDASGPVAPNTAINLKWTIDNFVSGMTAQISADADPGDANFTFGGQDVTLGADGSGTLAVTPTKEGDFNFTLKVTPAGGGAAVSSDPLKLTATAPDDSALQNPRWGADVYEHGQEIELSVDAVGVADGRVVYFAIEHDADVENWQPLQGAQATVSGGKATTRVVLKDPDESGAGSTGPGTTTTADPNASGTGSGSAPDEDICNFRFHVSFTSSPAGSGSSSASS